MGAIKMPKEPRTPLENVRQGMTKNIARLFFYTYETKTRATKILYPSDFERRNKNYHRGYVAPIITKMLNEWIKEGYIQISRVKIRYIGDRSKPTYAYLMTTKPIYEFCEKEKNIQFTEEEKSYFENLLLSERIRGLILIDYPKEDIINATLKFYVKNLIMNYFYLMRDIRENPKKYQGEIKRAEELNNPSHPLKKGYDKILKELHKKYAPNKKYHKTEFDTIQIIAQDKSRDISNELMAFQERNHINSSTEILIGDIEKMKSLENKEEEKQKLFELRAQNDFIFLFLSYLTEIEENKEFVSTIDNKILRALDINPL